MKMKCERWCIYYFSIAGALLLFTGVAKVMSSGATVAALNSPDPLLGLKYRQVYLFVGVFEMLLASWILFTGNRTVQSIVLLWFSGILLIYRVGRYWIGAREPCSCLGRLTEALAISPSTVDLLMKYSLAYLLLGALLTLYLLHSFGKNNV